MSLLWVEIEALAIEGANLSPARGERLARLTETALARLLAERGSYTRMRSLLAEGQEAAHTHASYKMRAPAEDNEAKWAEELALVLYRAIDRTQ